MKTMLPKIIFTGAFFAAILLVTPTYSRAAANSGFHPVLNCGAGGSKITLTGTAPTTGTYTVKGPADKTADWVFKSEETSNTVPNGTYSVKGCDNQPLGAITLENGSVTVYQPPT